MASILGLSQRTVKYHRANITKKLEVPNLMAAVTIKNLCCNADNNKFYELERIMMLIPGNVYWKDIEGRYLGCNVQQLHVARKKSLDKILGKTDNDLYSKEIACRIMKTDREIIEKRQEKTLEEIGVDSTGAETVYLTKKSPLYDEFGQVIGLVGIGIAITEKNRSLPLIKENKG